MSELKFGDILKRNPEIATKVDDTVRLMFIRYGGIDYDREDDTLFVAANVTGDYDILVSWWLREAWLPTDD